MQLLLDIGNTHTHVGIVKGNRLGRDKTFLTKDWKTGHIESQLNTFIGREDFDRAMLCSVVPEAEKEALFWLHCQTIPTTVLSHRNCGVPIDYPKPATIGPDRLANARAALELYGSPVVVVDFGTAVTFDIVDKRGHYVGGIIAPGIAAMTDYLHEKTALLPRITVRPPAPDSVIGKSTVDAMRIGAVHGYRGLVSSLLAQIKDEMGAEKLTVVATGGAADLIAGQVPEIAAVNPQLTLEGLRLVAASTK
ncbi:MAG: type III pantothenate kinase [Pedosphaera sp.]|nr:type III pantothenate kinase [Pedosphaera sp.]